MTKNKHKVYYYIGEELRYTDTYEFGATITKRGDEPQTGFTFTGWVGEPTIMQDEDVTVTGGYKVNSYEVSYYVDGNFYKTATVAYGVEVDLSGFETDDYKVVGWTLDEELLETLGMPAGNIQLHAKLEEKKVPLTETVGFAVGASIGGTATGFGLGQLIYYFLKKRRMRNMLE